MCPALKSGVHEKVKDPCVSQFLSPAWGALISLRPVLQGSFLLLHSPHCSSPEKECWLSVCTLYSEWDAVGILQILLCGVCE